MWTCNQVHERATFVNSSKLQAKQYSICTNHWLVENLSSKKFSPEKFFFHHEINHSERHTCHVSYWIIYSLPALSWTFVILCCHVCNQGNCLAWGTAQAAHIRFSLPWKEDVLEEEVFLPLIPFGTQEKSKRKIWCGEFVGLGSE